MGSRRFKRALALLVTSCILLAPFAASCDERLDALQKQIANLEEQEGSLESAVAFWEESIAALQTGRYVVVEMSFPLDGEMLASRTTGPLGIAVPERLVELYLGQLTADDELTPEAVEKIRTEALQRARQQARTFLTEGPKELARLEAKLRATKDQLAYLLDERARTRQSLDTYNPTRNCNWQECSCQWLAHTCTGGAIMGTTRESCGQWGGTYWHTNGHCGKGSCSFSEICPMPGHWCCR